MYVEAFRLCAHVLMGAGLGRHLPGSPAPGGVWDAVAEAVAVPALLVSLFQPSPCLVPLPPCLPPPALNTLTGDSRCSVANMLYDMFTILSAGGTFILPAIKGLSIGALYWIAKAYFSLRGLHFGVKNDLF